jgi:hypothetical protein
MATGEYMKYNQIVWLASYPKSGNTWVRCFMDAYFMGEVDINELLCSVPDNHTPTYSMGDGANVADLPIDIQQLIRPMALLRMVKQYIKRDHPIPLFVKTHNANILVNGMELMPLTLTKAAIVIVRHPYDVLPSLAAHTGKSYDESFNDMRNKMQVLTGNAVSDFISSWDNHTNSWLNDKIHNVKYFLYEDMKADPVKCFAEMLEHAGIEPDIERVKQAVKLVELDKLKKQEEKEGFSEASEKAGQFFGKKHKPITPRHKTLLDKAFGRICKRLYEKKKAA